MAQPDVESVKKFSRFAIDLSEQYTAAWCYTLEFCYNEKENLYDCQVLMAHHCCSGSRHYDSNSSDTELSEAEESRKSCIKRSKFVFFSDGAT